MSFEVRCGDALTRLREMPSESVHVCVTSPPYFGLRDYGVDGQIGLEETPRAFIDRLVAVFEEVRRVLRPDGTLWVNIGDSYAATGKSGGGRQGEAWLRKGADYTGPNGGKWRPAPHGSKPKDLLGIPWMLAFALRDAGWWLRCDIIWAKPACMPESIADRPTKSHEYIFLLAKNERYYFDNEAIKEPCSPTSHGGPRVVPGAKNAALGQGDGNLGRWTATDKERGRNPRSVWTINPEPLKDEHFAAYPAEIPRRAILAGSPHGGIALDPFCGSGTTGMVAVQEGRSFIGLELNPEYVEMARRRIASAEADVRPEAERPRRAFTPPPDGLFAEVQP